MECRGEGDTWPAPAAVGEDLDCAVTAVSGTDCDEGRPETTAIGFKRSFRNDFTGSRSRIDAQNRSRV
ncbi:hypothetical protein BJF78_23190 [Pseudonocardia sp. CNS-139]|nr:hypothetical protein BJF78_23190 [Pseudonocardia sp. CNS-139]